jgi:CubicO group peptidase (beta-lactamase class C family)
MSARNMNLRTVTALIVGVGILLLAANVVADAGPTDDPDPFRRLDAFVQDEMGDSHIPGLALAIVQDGQVAHQRGFGQDGHGHEITPATPFWIGSNTKSFTALAIMQLVESGQVDLDAPVQNYLPEFRVADPEASAQITVRHLLNQTSGFSRTDGLRMVAEAKEQSLTDAVASFGELELNRPVGESFQYSNPNFVVLGLLIERVTGQPWTAYIQTQIFEPLGMTRSFTTLAGAKANGLTTTYRYAFGVPFPTEGTYLEGLAPTGYLYSTAEDMARYLTMYLQGGVLGGNRVLSEAGIAQMLAPATNERTVTLQSQEFRARYGAGWFVGPFGAAEDARWHQGSLPYFTSWMVLLPGTNQAVVMLINAGNQFDIGGASAAWSRLPQGVVNLLRGERLPSGIGVTRFFIVFNTLIAAVLTAQVWSLVQVARRPAALAGRGAAVRGIAPLAWEIGFAGIMLLLIAPALMGGLGWRASLSALPDLTLVILATCGLWLATGAARGWRLVQAARVRRQPFVAAGSPTQLRWTA